MNESITPPMNPPVEPEPTVVTFQDRRTSLRVVGAIQCVLAFLLFALTLLIVSVTAMMSEDMPGATTASMLMSILMYGGIATVLLTLGIGACLTRRWGVALGKTLWGMALFTGVLTVLMMVVMFVGMPDLLDNAEAFLPEGQELPEDASFDAAAAMKMGLIFGAGFYFVFMVLMPLAFFLFYRGRDVYLTAQYHDSSPSWTDRIPALILAGACFCVFSGVSFLFMGFTMPIFVVGNQVLQGPVATLVYALYAAGALAMAWGFLKVHRFGWYGAWAWLALMLMYQVMLFTTDGYDAMFEAMYAGQDLPEGQLEMTRQFMSNPIMLASGFIWSAAILAYLLYTRKYFFPGDATDKELMDAG